MGEALRFRAEPRRAGDSGGAGFDVPHDIAAALAEAKRPDTRARRVAGTIERLHEGKPLR